MTQADAEELNHECFCLTLDRRALGESLAHELGTARAAQFKQTHPHLFASTPVFLSRADIDRMTRTVHAIEAAARLPGYWDAVMAWAPQSARPDFGPVGALMGYDFHIGGGWPRLIEVNTNAGGAFINAMAARAQTAICDAARHAVSAAQHSDFERSVTAMFAAEWRRQRRDGAPACIAIVDEDPSHQYMYPEFLLAQSALEEAGVDVVIADPRELVFDGQSLRVGNRPIDLVYNRLVDFGLDREENAALREAYLDARVVVTPNPHVHALLADKRNLAVLNDSDALIAWGLGEEPARVLTAAIPPTVPVTPQNADELWKDRRRWFFKPATGHGSKGTYRGSKLTRRVFDEIRAGGYVAQQYAPPGERIIKRDGLDTPLKMDVRLYTYAGEVLLVAARLYQGQATNLRTPGGGFAPVFQV